jgi:phenylalanyl-tRNA synthetase beta chain
MKIVESWLREWIDPDLDTDSLAYRLTMAGHEVDGIELEGRGLDGVLVAEVLEVGKHPDADRLSLCKVSTGAETVDVVCGAPNVRQGMKSPLARPGVTLPNGIKLKKAKIRGVESHGMLCSAVELGLGEDSDGIIELPEDAPVGAALAEYLSLPDAVIDLDLTPNRGDCFSVLGIAREVAAVTGAELKSAVFPSVPATIEDRQAVELVYPEGCPVFAGRIVRNIDPRARSPIWMVERLRRAGLRAIHPVVDVTNYVMLELGQPLHAYDLALVDGPIRPRLSKPGEKVTLLDENEVELDDRTMVITDDSGVIGLAGLMGGLSTAVSNETVDVFFEGAFWPQAFMAGRARSYGMHTDASLRFERGVDPEGQGRAVERATALLVDIAGGEAGPLVVTTEEAHLPERQPIQLRRDRVSMLLGLELDDHAVVDMLHRLSLGVTETDVGWAVVAPSHRFDLEVEVDLIEELARIYGYDEIPETTAIAETPLEVVSESLVDIELAAATLVARDYREVITYSFVAADANKALTGIESELVLSNPISSEMSVMRASLWPGMLQAVAANASRQQDRVRLFEIGKSFHGSLEQHEEVLRIAGAVSGPALPEQWASSTQASDFFDIKGDIAALLALAGNAGKCRYVPAEHPALQPGQAAEIVRDGRVIGVFGKLHPMHAKPFELRRDVFLFELDADAALASGPPTAGPVSRYPSIRRDIAIVVDENVSADELVAVVEASAPEIISSVRIFDIYQGPGIEAGLKSVALGLILQETSRTLTDADADSAMQAAVSNLQDKFAAELRE